MEGPPVERSEGRIPASLEKGRTRMTTTTEKVPAREVEPGSMLPGMGNGYVVEVENDVECSAFTGRYNVVLGTFTVLTWHDVEGNEEYALLSPETLVEVAR